MSALTTCCSSFSFGLHTHDKPSALKPALARDLYRPEVLKFIEETLDSHSHEIHELSVDISDNPELAFEERKTHDKLTTFMESHGFEVQRHYLLETAWRADFSHGKGGRTLGVNSEMDALPGIGHACGHNLIAACGVGVALAVKAALVKFDIPGKVFLLGTPAEEDGGGKVILLEKGGYKGMDACVMSHPGPGPDNLTAIGSSLAIQSVQAEYFGHTAHAAIAPWEGRNALDAAVIAYNSIGVLRQQIRPDYRVHGIIEGRNLAANVIPDYTRTEWIVRAPTADEALVLRDRIVNCLEAAGKATACEVKLSTPTLPYHDLRNNPALSQNFADASTQGLGMTYADLPDGIGGSTDFGNVTYEVPGIHPVFSIPTVPNGGNHTVEFTESARTKEAHKQNMLVTKALAHTGFRVLDDDKFYEEVKDSFEKTKALHKALDQ